jgi:1-deoxy-D-xylulose-5-phosphate reductoisomerase
MVEFSDGSTIAQLSNPDMRLPIGYALSYPDRLDIAFGSLDLLKATTLTFEPPDRGTFRCLDLAYEAGRVGGAAPAWLSAANEIAVEAFLEGRLSWGQIAEVVESTLQSYVADPLSSLEALVAADAKSREVARTVVGQCTNN